jgi:hypothetical protein
MIAIGSVSCALAGCWSLFAGRNAATTGKRRYCRGDAIHVACLLFAGAGISNHESRFLSPLLSRLGISCRCGFSSVLKPMCHIYVYQGLVGTALTFSTCLGFTITTVSQHSNGGSLVA